MRSIGLVRRPGELDSPPVLLDVRGLGWRRCAILAWAVGGVLALLVQAILKLTPLALWPLLEGELTIAQGALYVGWVVANGYAEGYRGFQRRFSPRVVARAFYLAQNPRPLHVLAAPLFAMSLLHAARRQRIVAWSLLAGITTLVLLVRRMDQPWRGIIDGGVVIALCWGSLSIVALLVRALRTGTCAPPPDLPDA